MLNISRKEKLEDFNQPFVIALDGASASGKGLIGRLLAKKFKLEYLESGRIYRGLGYLCIQKKIDISDISQMLELASSDILSLVKDIDLNLEEIALYTSKISTIREIRESITKIIINRINASKRIIVEGRDIGTVVVPDADIKIFMTASPEVRAGRRYKQLKSEGKVAIIDDVFNSIIERDQRDSSREFSPLKPARDAFVVDTSDMNPDKVIDTILRLV